MYTMKMKAALGTLAILLLFWWNRYTAPKAKLIRLRRKHSRIEGRYLYYTLEAESYDSYGGPTPYDEDLSRCLAQLRLIEEQMEKTLSVAA